MLIKRGIEIVIVLFVFVFFSPILFIISFLLIFYHNKNILYISDRIGRSNITFKMYKFRTMNVNSPELATHLLTTNKHVTSIGFFLRKYSLDELPQLINILKGEMTFIGPRPALYNQNDLIELRTQNKIETLKPGITGWAQVNGRDNLSIIKKVELDTYYYHNKSILLNLKILFLTIYRVFKAKDIKH